MTTATTPVTEGGKHPPASPRRRRGPDGSALVRYGFIAPAALYLALFFGYPIVKNFTMSFQEYTSATFYSGEAPFVGLANYAAVLGDPIFAKALANTAIFTIVSIAGQFVIGMALALFFRRSFPLSGVLRSMLLLPWLLPMIVSAAVWRWILEQDSGILNQTLSALGLISSPIPWLTSSDTALIAVVLVNIWLGVPFNVVLLYSGLQAIPGELYEAAEIDGAGAIRTAFSIKLPALRPALLLTTIFSVIGSFQLFNEPNVLRALAPTTISSYFTPNMYAYNLAFNGQQYNYSAAVAIIVGAVTVVVAALAQRLSRAGEK